MDKYQTIFQEFKEALLRLGEVLEKEKNEFIRDSAIKRFELTFDLSWKTIKAWLENKGSTCTSPLGCFKEAYRQGLVEFEDVWLKLVETRNKTVHTYSLKIAEEVYDGLPDALTAFKKLLGSLEEKV